MKLKRLEVIFQAFSDKTRLRIMGLLIEGELCVCDVMSVLKEPQSKISRHFAYLKRAGAVTGRKEGLWMYYRLTGDAEKVFASVLQGLFGNSGRIEELCRDRAELKRQRSKLVGCCK